MVPPGFDAGRYMETVFQGQKLFLTRLSLGLAQGLILYLLYRAVDAKVWPATQGLLFAPLLLVSLATPIGLTLALGAMPYRKALVWCAIASAVLALLGFFDNWMSWPLWQSGEFGYAADERPQIVPSPQLFVFGGGALFIAHALVTSGLGNRRFMASYSTLFNVAWKLAVQLALAAFFVGAFWLLLWLGAGLFNLIKLGFFQELIKKDWFAISVSAVVTAGALHLTDVRPSLVEGARTLLLTLLSWLLPVITLIVTGFVISLPFTGLEPLWGFGHATALLLVASAALLILINAAYQDGSAEHRPPTVICHAARLAALLTVPLTLIAAYALYLRVNQYGWTVDRITVAAILVVALSYAGGYAHAAVIKGEWLAGIPRWNFAVSLLAVALIVLLFTPIASPQRIAVNDQVARLRSGAVSAQKFDFLYLREHGGRYGRRALQALAQDRDAAVKRRARNALEYRFGPRRGSTPQMLEDQIAVYPQGERIPASFLKNDWSKEGAWGCLTQFGVRCDLVLMDLDGDGAREAILIQAFAARVFREAEGGWRAMGNFTIPRNCGKMMDALRRGNYRVVPPQHRWNDLEIAGVRVAMIERAQTSEPACPKP